MSGLFAEPKLNNLFYGAYNNYVGFFYGLQMGDAKSGVRQMGVQLLGVLFVTLLNVTVTSLICLFIRLLMPMRMSEEDMEVGDEAYAIWGQGDKLMDTTTSTTLSKYGTSLYDDLEARKNKRSVGR